jgi:hypothetical protein
VLGAGPADVLELAVVGHVGSSISSSSLPLSA